jgi:hypothetical protein
MAKTQLKVGQLVEADGMLGVYRVVRLSPDGVTADIERYDISKERSVGDPTRPVAQDKLNAYKEDPREAAARIVRDIAEEES